MKVSKTLQTHLDRQYKIEFKRTTKQNLIKKAAQKDIEITLYEKRVQTLYLIKHAQLGKNVDGMC